MRLQRPFAVLTALLSAAALAVAAAPTYAEAPASTRASAASAATSAAARQAAPRRAVVQSKRIVVQWSARQKKRKVYQRTANVPGIGAVDLVCRPKATMLRIRPASRDRETQLWMAKFQPRQGADAVAVKTVRVYRYANADDNGRGGTGPRAHEGLNRSGRIEDFARGNAYGVISQRPGRNAPGGGALTTPATSFQLTWWWERFRHPGYQYCRMALTLRTDTTRQFGLSWHGSAEAAARPTTTTTIPGVGTAVLTCEPGSLAEDQTVAFRPSRAAGAYLDYEYIQGEGDVDDHVDHYDDLDVDPTTGLLGPVDLPRNGMMRLWVSVGGVKRAFVLSSYFVVNNAAKPQLNLCEVAATPLP